MCLCDHACVVDPAHGVPSRQESYVLQLRAKLKTVFSSLHVVPDRLHCGSPRGLPDWTPQLTREPYGSPMAVKGCFWGPEKGPFRLSLITPTHRAGVRRGEIPGEHSRLAGLRCSNWAAE